MAPFKSTHVFSGRLNTAHQFPSVQAVVTHISLTVMCFRRQVGNGCKHVLQRCFSLKQTSSHCCLYFVWGCGQPFHSAACSISTKHGACHVLVGASSCLGILGTVFRLDIVYTSVFKCKLLDLEVLFSSLAFIVVPSFPILFAFTTFQIFYLIYYY